MRAKNVPEMAGFVGDGLTGHHIPAKLGYVTLKGDGLKAISFKGCCLKKEGLKAFFL